MKVADSVDVDDMLEFTGEAAGEGTGSQSFAKIHASKKSYEKDKASMKKSGGLFHSGN